MISLLSFIIRVQLCTQAAADPDTSLHRHSKLQDTVYREQIVVFVWPDSLELNRLKLQMGAQDFYVAADDENWYRAQAFNLLDSLGIESTTVDHKKLRFRVADQIKEYDWSNYPAAWFVVLYDGRSEPTLTHSIDLPNAIPFLLNNLDTSADGD